MERVSGGVREIRAAGQDRDHVVAFSGVEAMRDVAVQVGGVAEEQLLGFGRIREGGDATRECVEGGCDLQLAASGDRGDAFPCNADGGRRSREKGATA